MTNQSATSKPITIRKSGAILIVEDDDVVRNLCMEYVLQLGYEALSAVDGEEGVRAFAERKDEIVCVLLDLTMPRMNGLAAFREMKRLRDDVRVILCSGYDEQDATERFTLEGLAGFLQKPYRLQELAERIAAVVPAGELS
ncbi:MAG: response regulator [Vicinamibacteria bacterium]|jgi:DNA-binding response OmpR family regulator|nr:response regulator [Vicinamibacteria bacterium]